MLYDEINNIAHKSKKAKNITVLWMVSRERGSPPEGASEVPYHHFNDPNLDPTPWKSNELHSSSFYFCSSLLSTWSGTQLVYTHCAAYAACTIINLFMTALNYTIPTLPYFSPRNLQM